MMKMKMWSEKIARALGDIRDPASVDSLVEPMGCEPRSAVSLWHEQMPVSQLRAYYGCDRYDSRREKACAEREGVPCSLRWRFRHGR